MTGTLHKPSVGALRLLRALYAAGAHGPQAAVTDARLAELTGLPVREIIDRARELMHCGVPVGANTSGARGRWLPRAGNDEDLAALRRYHADLVERGRAVLGRAAALKAAIDRFALTHQVDPTGQHRLFTEPEVRA